MVRIGIVVIGDELLLGQVTDTNSGFISRTVGVAGWTVRNVEIVGDNADDILRAIDRAMAENDVVITTGGLGPTKDDITKATLCAYFGGGLHFDSDVMATVEQVMRKRSREINELTRSQAMVPDACRVIQNRVGTAPIMWFELGGHVLVSMPGVPFETEEMFVSDVFPQLLARYGSDVAIEHRVMTVSDFSESRLAETIADIEETMPPFLHLAYLPTPGYVRLRIDGIHADRAALIAEIDAAHAKFATRLGEAVIAMADETPARTLLRLLDERGMTVATAESCTGGNIAHELTLIPGSSSAMVGGVVAYSNHVKSIVLGVDAAVIETYGAVSIPVVKAMAEGACRVTGADVAMATSGIAGPGGATPGKPVGTVCIAVAVKGSTVWSDTRHFAGDRRRVINHATSIALIEAIKSVRKL